MEKEINTLTGLYFNHSFFEHVDEFLKNVNREDYCMMAVDIEHFHLFNKIHGRVDGDKLLKTIADILKEFQENHGGVAGYLGGDNFAIVSVYEEEVLNQLRCKIQEEIQKSDYTVGYRPAFGIYRATMEEVPAVYMYDNAIVAMTQILGNYFTRSCEYYPDMDEKLEEEMRLLADIQRGMENDEFTFFIQPQCDITKAKIVGGESLVRWIRSDGTMVSPGVFIPVLEKNGLIADLDKIIWEKVCQWLRNCIDRGYNPVPVSVNVSRMDIFSMNVPEYLAMLMKKYDLDSDLLKVEITESAYVESGDRIICAVQELQKNGFLVMMDDFGSGYSSLNMLKSVPVDVLKMDMRFLEMSENEEEKGVGILESVINMARQMKVPVVVEGVEFKKHEVIIQKMGCRYTQGYFYYKPMNVNAFEEILSDDRNMDHEGFWYRQSESLHVRELMDTNLFSDATINNLLGAVAFYDMYENNIEITRVNEQYLKLAGIARQEEEEFRKRFWNHVRDDDRQLLFSIFNEAYENPADGATGYIHYVRTDGVTLWVQIRVFFLTEKAGHKSFCANLSDMTELKGRRKEAVSVNFELDELTEAQKKQVEETFGGLPCGYAIGKLSLKDGGAPADYEIIYANKELRRISGGDGSRLRYMMSKLFADRMEEMLDKAYRAAYLGEHVEFHIYSHLSGRYLDMIMYQYQYGYVGCLVQDDTHSQIYESSLNNIMSSFREVYFLHLEDNYCRMVYPDENHLLDRGVYEEVLNRHFEAGKIMPYDEENIRKWLSLDNLRKVLENQDSVEFQYKRSIEPAGEEWCLTTVMVSERRNGKPITATITVRSIESLVRERANSRRKSMSQTLAHMSEGFLVYCTKDDGKILYVNPAVIKMFGCDTVDEFRALVNNSFKGAVYPDDYKRVAAEIEDQVYYSDKNMDFICYRIVTKDGRIRWVEDCGHMEDTGSGNDAKLFYVFLSDITDTITDARKESIDTVNKEYNK